MFNSVFFLLGKNVDYRLFFVKRSFELPNCKRWMEAGSEYVIYSLTCIYHSIFLAPARV